MTDRIDVLELNRAQFEDAGVKNSFIRDTSSEYLAFVNSEETNRQELLQVLTESGLLASYDAVVFGENVPQDGELFSSISAFDMNVYALVYKRNVMASVGCFNDKLAAGINYEFLCRISEGFDVCFVPCASENETCCEKKMEPEFVETLAYVLKKYMVKLQAAGRLESLFGQMVTYCSANGQAETFNTKISEFLDGSIRFDEIDKNTAPFYMIMGDDTCHGVLRDFADMLATELIGLGQAVVTSKGALGRHVEVNELEKMLWKGLIGFQAPALEKDFFKGIKAKKFQFWFDNPAFFADMFHCGGDDYYILCQDAFYAEHIKKYYDIKNAMQFPPAGRPCLCNFVNKLYDVVFIGAYNKPDYSYVSDEFSKVYFDYMIEHPDMTFEQGLSELIKPDERFMDILYSLSNVCRTVINCYREKVVDMILAAGIKLHVYGDTWNSYDGPDKDNLIIHRSVSPEESMKVMADAKISLNVMTWHKAGMTERIANSMLAGAVCLSDETVYLKENFSEDEIVLFDLKHLEEIPEKINKILGNDEYRIRIAQKAYAKAIKEHTWRRRAQQLLGLVEE